MERYLTPLDERISFTTHVGAIQQAIDIAKETGVNAVLIPRFTPDGKTVWNVDKAIKLPSNMTVYLDNCHLRLTDGSFTNVFVNSNYKTEIGDTLEGEQHDINIIGLGNNLIDGGNYNGLSEKTSNKDGFPSIQENVTILFHNVRDFKVTGVKIKHQRWWAMLFKYCRFGQITDIGFNADLAYKDENGNRCTDRLPLTRQEVWIKNADGVDLRQGCNNILIENIYGNTEDDTVALTNIYQSQAGGNHVEGKDTDIHDVVIKNIRSDAYTCSNVRLLSDKNTYVYNIVIDGVIDSTTEDCPYRAGAAVKISDSDFQWHGNATVDNMKNISINNIFSRANYGVKFLMASSNVSVNNVFMKNPKGYAVAHDNGYVYPVNSGPFGYKNVNISNVYYQKDPEVEFPVDFDNCTAENFNVCVNPEIKVNIKNPK